MTKLISYFVLFIVLVFAQTILPHINVFHSSITFDLLLVFLTIVALQISTFSAILIGFSIGISQDLTTQQNLLGSLSFMKSISGFTINYLTRFDKTWNRMIRYLFILGCYALHYSIYYYIRFSGMSGEFMNALISVGIHSLLNLFLLWFIDRFVFNHKLI